MGRLTSPEEFDNIIVKNSPNGLVQLKDVGRAVIGAEGYSTALKFAGHDAMGLGVEQLSNANSLDVDKKAKAALEQLSKNFPPGLEYAVAFDSTTAVGQSIHEVLITLAAAIVIVIAVIFLFLLDWRATIIPAVTIPVSLIGTFAFIRIFDFSINSLTLFGITLATGLVVDDAIVVIENVQRHIHMEHSDAHEATSRAMREVTSAVIATSLVLIAVFVPVSFFPGATGILYRQFSLTIAFSIAISAFNALTLSPALSALFLRGEEARPRQLDFLHIKPVSRAFAAFIHGADAFVSWLGQHICARHSCRAAIALCAPAGLFRRNGGHGMDLPDGSHRLYPAGRPGLLHGDCAGSAGIVACLHHRSCRRGRGHHRAESPRGGAVFHFGLQLCRQRVQCGHDVCEHQHHRRARRQELLDGGRD